MTKLHIRETREPDDALRGGVKFYVLAVLLAVLIVGGVAYWVFAFPH